jgi:hypothetical protein
MELRNVLLSALAPLLSGLLIAAPAVAQEAQGVHGKAKEAAVTMAPLGTPLTFSVKGLTMGNLEQVTQSLTSMTETVYVCPKCRHMQATDGKCTGCNVKLEAKEEPIFSKALPSSKDSNIRLTPFTARTVSYAALEVTLAKNSIKIDGSRFPLAGESRLVLRGGAPENAKTIEKALKASGCFDSAKASYDTVSNEIHVVVRAGTTPPTYDKVQAVIDSLETKASLVDVIWGPQEATIKT